MAKKWSDVAGSPAFQALSLEEQEEARNQYFESIVAPQVPEEDLPVVRDQFLSTTSLPKAPAPQPGKRDTVDNPLNPAKDERGFIQRVADYLKPSPKSVMDGYTATPQQVRADLDRRLSYGAGPISSDTASKADLVRSGFEKSDNPVVQRTAKGMDRVKAPSFGELVQKAKDPTNVRGAREAKAEEFRTPGEWAVDTLSSLSQGGVGLVQLPINIIAPSSEIAQTLRDTQKELQAAESDVLKASRERLKERVLSEEGFFDKYVATVQQLVTDPTLAISEAAKQLPNFLGIVGAARVVGAATSGAVNVAGRVSPAVALSEAITAGGLSAGARAIGTTAGGVTASMVMAGGDAAGNVYENLTDRNKVPLSVWKQNPDFQKLVKEGKTESQAIEEIATTKARMAALMTAPLGLLGYAGAEAAIASRGLGRTAAEALTVKGMAKTAGKDLVGEQLEEGGTQLGSNVVTRTVDPKQSLLEGVPEAMGTALVTSGPFTAAAIRGQYKDAQQQQEQDQMASAGDLTATYLLDPKTYDPTLIDPSQTTRPPGDVGTAAPMRSEMNFTPADSPSAQAGLAPIIVLGSTEVPDVSTDSATGAAARLGGVPGSDQFVGGVGLPGLGVDGTARIGGDAGSIAANAGANVAARGRAGELPAGLGRLPQVDQRATDQDLAARVQAALNPQQNNNANTQPTEQWFGRKGDGYITEADAGQALPGRQRMFPTLDWKVEQMPSGKYRLAGYSKETANVTQAAQAQQATQERQETPVASTRQFSDLLARQPAVPDAVLAEFARNPSAPDSRASVQTYLDDLVASGRVPSAPKLGTPDADAETTVSALGAIFGDATGTGNRVIAYSDPGGDNGFALGGIAFVNTSLDSTGIDAPRTVLHELRHVAEQLAAAGSKSAQEFTTQLDSIFDDMTDEGKRAYIENFLHKKDLAKIADPAEREAKLQEFMTAPATRSEMVADFLGNRAQDREFLIDLAQQDPQGFEGFVRRWLTVIDNLIAKLRGGKTQGTKESAKVDQYIRDLNKAKMVARDALIQFRKGNLAERQVQVQTQQEAEPVMSRRGAEQVGEFEVRTMKDGTAVVYGDPEAIRAQIPEDVKGRVTKDGIVFTTSAAPRVKAALGGRTTAYSREGAVLDKLPIKDGKYVGAPAKFNTPGKIPTLRKILRQLADEGAPGRYWYENSSREVLKMVGGDVQEARKFVALLAIYSPQAKVDANSTFALRAWAQYKNGQPISVKTGSQDRKATEAMQDVDAFWKGEKTGNFFFNLLREIDPSTAGKQGATIDMWMMRAGQYDNDAPTQTQYAFMENETNRLAAELGWEPQQVQAAIWVAMKARMENSGVKKRTEASSEKKGWIRYDYPLKNGKPFKTRVILDAQKHRDNWLKYSFEHDVTKDDTQQAKFDFGDGLKRHIGQVSFEARPGRSTGVLPGIHSAPYAQQVAFQQAVQKTFFDDQGNDLLAMRLGLLVDNDILVPGVWQGEVSPSTQLGVAMAPAKGDDGKTKVDPAQAEALNVYAAVAGLVARQEGVGWHRPFYASTKRDANGLDINLGRAINPREAADLEQAVGQWMVENGKEGWQDSFAFVSSPTGIRVVNFGIITNDILQSDIVSVAEGVLPEFEYRVFASDGDMPTNNWKENPNGESYVQRISAAGRSDVLDWARAVLAPRVQSVFTEFSKEYGWGDAGEIKFSRRDAGDRAGRDQGGSLAPLDGAPRIDGATGPDEQLVAVAEQYARDNGIDLKRQAEYVQVDPERATRIAQAYEDMPHSPRDPRVKEAYENLVRQTTAQYEALKKAGYKFYFFDETNDPYEGNPWNAMRELRNNKRMGVFATEAGFGSGATDLNVDDNPLLADTGITWPYGSVYGKQKRVLANDLFRAVHDAFGHGLEGAGFRSQGEENAWQAHVRLFTGSARGAITSETRGQNSWLNYGPYAESNRDATVEDTVFADQKTGLMPEWTWSEGLVGDMPAFSQREDRSGISQLAYQGYQIVDTPRVQASRKINGIIKKLDDGKLTPAEFELQVRLLADRMAVVTATKEANKILSTRERGADIVREKLLAARRRNEVDSETTEFALWALAQNPAMAEGLGISVREQPANQRGAAGDYNPAAEIMRVFKGKANEGTAVHEILHHTERMMPAAVQVGIRKEWAKAYSKALSKADEKQRAAIEQMLPAMAGDQKAQKLVREAFSDGTLSADDHYQLVNPSEYWAVNATDILKRRYEAGSWIGQAKQWLSEMLQKAKGLLGLRSDAPILRGLQAVLDGNAKRQPGAMMLANVDSFADITAPDTPAFKRWFGDSKVVDENGQPLVVYHTGVVDTNELISGAEVQQRLGTALIFANEGIYFTADPDYSAQYGRNREGAIMYPVYLSIQNPFVIPSKQELTRLEKLKRVFLSKKAREDANLSDGADRMASMYITEKYKAELIEQGYDGIINEAYNEIVAFDPTQIKSATGNQGTFDPANPDIRFSQRQQPIQGQQFYLKGETRTAKQRRIWQDYFLRMREVQEAIADQGGVVDEAQDVYLAEALSYGRLQEQLTDFKEKTVKPMLAKLRAAKLETSDLALYAYAMHAKERNAEMSSRNARLASDEGSGMTDQEADDIINAYQADGKLQALQDIHKDLMAITSTTRLVLLDEGLISQDEFDAYENQYSYYVPLRGFITDESDLVSGEQVRSPRVGGGKGFNIRGKETVRALGRTSRAGHIIENIISDYERAIARAERNNVAKKFLDLVTTNPDPALWEIDAKRTAASFNKQTGTVQYNKLIDKGEDTVSVKVDGKEVYIKVNDPLLVRALRQAGKDETGEVTKFLVKNLGWFTNLMRNTLTRFNPAFGVTNAVKDFGFASTSMLADLGPKGMALFIKNYANPKQSGPIYEEFRAAGATTGGWHMRNTKDMQKELRRMMTWEGGSGTKFATYRAAKGLLDTLEWVGQYSETQARFAAYKAAREMGLSPARAASIAKEVSTNFNRKGEWGSAMNTAYVFFNAGVQGTAKTLKNLRSPYVMGAMTALTGLSTALAFMAASTGGDDEDGQAYWDKIPDEIKQRNIIIMLPPGEPLIGTGYARVGSRGRYIKIPIQYGLNVFSTLGYQIADVLRHGEDAKRGKTLGQAAINMTSVTFGAFNPMGGAFDPTKPVDVALAAAPSIVDVAIQFGAGVDAFGKPTSPAKSPFDQKPDSESYSPAMAGSWEQRLTTWLNANTGGDAAVAGAIDLAPGTVRNMVRNVTGGTGDFLSSLFVNIPSKMMDPAADINSRDIPVLKAFYGEADESTDMSEYYKRRAEVMKAAEEAGRRAKLGIKFDYDEDSIGLQSLGKATKVYTDLMSELRKREIEIATDESLPKSTITQMRKDLRRESVSVARDFNALFMQMKQDKETGMFLNKEILEYEPSDAVLEKAQDYKLERRQKLQDNKDRAAGLID